MRQPAVLGELFAGILLGNLVIFGFNGAESLKTNETVAALAELGVIILLFEVGLESGFEGDDRSRLVVVLVAVLGVIAPFFLGWAVSAYFIPDEPRAGPHLHRRTLCATSVGITRRVFKDLGKLETREARIILGAAVIDDVLGATDSRGGSWELSRPQRLVACSSMLDVGVIAVKSVAFLIGAIADRTFPDAAHASWRRPFAKREVFANAGDFVLSVLSWASAKVGLAPIVGAFAAGLILDEVHYQTAVEKNATFTICCSQ